MTKRLPILLCAALLTASVARAEPILYSAVLRGVNENPSNTSPAFGIVLVAYDPVAHTLGLMGGFTDLLGPTTAAHIHCCGDPPANSTPATPVPSLPDFPLGVTFGTFMTLLDLTSVASYNPAFLMAAGGTAMAAELALANGLALGQSYFNIHSEVFSGGEIRGFLTAVPDAAPIPEPTTLLLVGGGVGLVAAARRRRMSRSKPS